MLAKNHIHPKLLYEWNTWVFFVFFSNNSSGGLELLFPCISVESTKIALYKQQKVWKSICTLSLLCQLEKLLGYMRSNKN